MLDVSAAYRQYFPLLVRKCTRMLRDRHEAEDVAQESFARLCREGPLGAGPHTVSAWLYRTSTRLSIDRLRARGRHSLNDEALDSVIGGVTPDAYVTAQSAWNELVMHVSDEELSAALLVRVDGLSQLEVGQVLGVHERTVRRLLTRFEAVLATLERGDPS